MTYLIFISLFININLPVEGCIKSSMYYRSQFRSQSHIFVPDEYQPTVSERSLDASGPMESHDFQLAIPTPRLVRVDSPNVLFSNEEARWMTKGCRDRLLKLVTQIHNTWPNNVVKLKVTRSWIKPPPSFQNLKSQNKMVFKRGFTGYRQKQTLRMDVAENGPKISPRQRYRASNLHDFRNNFDASNHNALMMHKPRSNLSTIESVVSASKRLSNRHIFDVNLHHKSKQTTVFNEHNKLNKFQLNKIKTLWQEIDEHNRATEQPKVTTYKWLSPKVSSKFLNSGNSDRSNVQEPGQLTSSQHMVMEDFHYAGRAVDMILVDVGKNPSRSKFGNIYPGQLAQMAYYGALFDWCFFSRLGHVHCSVKPDSIITSQWFGCFPGYAQTRLQNGSSIMLSLLSEGDNVQTYDLKSHRFIPTTVAAFLHRDEHQFANWIEIVYFSSYQKTSALRLTANHLIYRKKVNSTSITDIESVFANEIQPGEFIVANLHQNVPFCKVLSVVTIDGTKNPSKVGVYAPLTTSGTIVIDGVLVSCFAHFRNEWLAKWSTFPLSVYFYLKNLLIKICPGVLNEQGVHWYAEMLHYISRYFLPDQMFFTF